jgi:hypothetical protein
MIRQILRYYRVNIKVKAIYCIIMELQTFVKKVILQIADGMQDVINEQHQHDIVVNPRITIGSGDETRFIPTNLESYKNYQRPVQLLRLEMNVNATSENALEVGGEAGFKWFGFGGKGKESASEGYNSKVSITIPISLPTTPVTI